MNCYFIGMMYGRSCAKFSYFVPIIPLKWPPEALVCDWPIKKSSVNHLNQLKFGGNRHWRFCTKFPQNKIDILDISMTFSVITN